MRHTIRSIAHVTAVVALISLLASASHAAAFTNGNVVIYRVGDGVAALVNTGNAVFLDEYTPAGAFVQSVALPTTAGGGNNPLITSGTATSEGQMTRSADGQYLILPGYARDLGGTGSLGSTTAAAVPRTVGRVKFDGSINTSTALTDWADTNNARGATSTNGTDLWVSGGAGGVRYTTLGSTTSTQLSTDLANVRQVLVFGGQLYVSTQNGTAIRIGAVGSGTPTTAGQSITSLPGIPTSATTPNGFFFANVPGGTVLYVTDDTAGQIQKYSLVSGTWTANGTITAAAVRGITGAVSGSTVNLYATTGGGTATGGGTLYGFADGTGFNGSVSGSANTLASANANTAFRGVAMAPANVPTPTPTNTPTGPTATRTMTPTITSTPADTATPTNTPVPVAFTSGDVVVYRVGRGHSSLANTGNAVFLDEYTPSGTLVQSVGLPTTPEGPNNPLIASGAASSEGFLTLSVDGQYLLLTGYASTIPAASSLSGTAASAVPRVVGRVKGDGSIDTTTALTDFADGNNPRTAASVDGTEIWVGGAAGGVRYTTLGSTTSTQLSTDSTNIRQVAIFDGQLYMSTQNGSTIRVGAVGSGLPTASGATITNLPGFPTTNSPNAFFFADLDGSPGLDTLYVADDVAGLGKFSLVSGAWVAGGVIGSGADVYRGVTGAVSGTTVTLYATRTANELVQIIDSSGYNGTLSAAPVHVASAGTNQAYRGVAMAPQGVGFIPPDKVTSKCEDKVSKNVAKLAACVLKCQIKEADTALKAKPPFDVIGCKQACRAKYDTLAGANTNCPSCQDATAQSALADGVASFITAKNAPLYCAGSTALPTSPGFIPPDPATGKCEDAVAKGLGKLAGCTMKCLIKQADAGLKMKSFDFAGCVAGKACRAKFDVVSQTLAGCPSCLDTTAQGTLADAYAGFVQSRSGGVYCSGTQPLQ
jgi:hypothetical protein